MFKLRSVFQGHDERGNEERRCGLNNKAHLRPKDFDSNGDIIPMACKEVKGDLISREALKKQIKNDYCKNHCILPNAEYYCPSNCSLRYFIKIIDNAPTVELDECVIQEVLNKRCMTAVANEYLITLHGKIPQGKWVVTAEDNDGVHRICCPFCSYEKGSNNTDTIIVTFTDFPKFCENCGAKLKGGADNDVQ